MLHELPPPKSEQMSEKTIELYLKRDQSRRANQATFSNFFRKVCQNFRNAIMKIEDQNGHF